MFDPWIPIGLAAIIILGVATGAYIAIRGRECRIRENLVRQEEYSILLSAITRVHLAGDDEARIADARLALADRIHRVNLIAGHEVLVHVNSLLELQNHSTGGGRDPAREHAVLQRLVHAMRREMNSREMNRSDMKEFAFRFYLPVPSKQEDIRAESGRGRSR